MIKLKICTLKPRLGGDFSYPDVITQKSHTESLDNRRVSKKGRNVSPPYRPCYQDNLWLFVELPVLKFKESL